MLRSIRRFRHDRSSCRAWSRDIATRPGQRQAAVRAWAWGAGAALGTMADRAPPHMRQATASATQGWRWSYKSACPFHARPCPRPSTRKGANHILDQESRADAVYLPMVSVDPGPQPTVAKLTASGRIARASTIPDTLVSGSAWHWPSFLRHGVYRIGRCPYRGLCPDALRWGGANRPVEQENRLPWHVLRVLTSRPTSA